MCGDYKKCAFLSLARAHRLKKKTAFRLNAFNCFQQTCTCLYHLIKKKREFEPNNKLHVKYACLKVNGRKCAHACFVCETYDLDFFLLNWHHASYTLLCKMTKDFE